MAGALFCTSAGAQSSVTLAWNASAASNLAGYKVYYGQGSGDYGAYVQTGTTTATVPGLIAGRTYYFAVTAYDTSGLESDYSSEISYAVPVGAPTVTLSSPGNGAIYVAPATVNLAAAVVANGHTITKVQFYNGSTLLGQDTSAPYTYAWNNVSSGAYSVTARITYDSGTTATSPAATLNVSGASPASILTFHATSGTITLPLLVVGGTVLQNVLTDLLGGGSATYNFNITKAGYYCVSAMVNAPSTSQNSFFVNIDAQPTNPLMIWDIPVTSGFANQVVSWRGNGNGNAAQAQYPRKAFYLAAGSHQLIIRGMDANVALQSISIFAAPPMLKTTTDANGHAVLIATGQAGQTYDVMACQNFSAWTTIGSVTLDANGSAQFTDPKATTMANRMYRLSQH